MKKKFIKSLLAVILSASMAFPLNVVALAQTNDPQDTAYDTQSEASVQPESTPSLANGDDGMYQVTVTTGESMFVIQKAVVTLKSGQMTAVLTFESTSYSYMYSYGKQVGVTTAGACTSEDKALIVAAAGTTQNSTWITPTVLSDGSGETFIVPVAKLDTPLGYGSYSAKKAQWYGRAISFASAGATYLGAASEVKATGVTVSPTTQTLAKAGDTCTVAAVVAPADATDQTVTFTSDNSKIASVDASTGVVTAVAAGVAKITATTKDGGFTAVCTVTVSDSGTATTVQAASCDLSMFSFTSSTAAVQADGTVKVTLVTSPVQRIYNKIALVSQTSTDAEKEAAAITADPVTASGTNYYSTFTFTIPVSEIGQKLPISFNQTSKGVTEWHIFKEEHYLTILDTPDIVGQLIDAIYVQDATPATGDLCTAAKTCWDALSTEDKAKVNSTNGDPDYFGRDTGDASLDNPRNQDDIGDNELLVVSFGTSFNESRSEDIGGIENALAEAYPNYSVRRAFTAQIIINHVRARDSEVIDNITEAMDRAVSNHVKKLVVQPTHLMDGAEYDEFTAVVNQYKDKIPSISIGSPLLSVKDPKNGDYTPVSEADYESVIKIITDETATYAADADTAVVFMGHGTSHAANKVYEDLQERITKDGYSHYFIGTVEGKPASTAVTNIIADVQKAGYTKVVLRPLMVVAGDHANNDMAGDDAESWKSQFTAAGFTVTTVIQGLGRIPDIEAMYVAHAKEAIDNLPIPFTDASSDAWYYSALKFVYQNDIMTGMDATTFGVSVEIPRAQFITMLYRMAGKPAVTYSAVFPDVKEGAFYTSAVLWANSVGIVKGYQNGNFGPSDSVTREQIAVMLYRYASYKNYDVSTTANLLTYPDAARVSKFAVDAMEWAVGSKIISGSKGYLNPQSNAKRVECAAMIMRFYNAIKE